MAKTATKIKIKKFTLKNGLKILVNERPHHPVVCCMIWYRVGSRNEVRGETGLSHFLEHMMFKGTRMIGKGEVDRLTAQLGGSNNAFTNTDHTAYYFNFASDRWLKALDIEADRMRNCLMIGREFEAEKKVVLEELKMGKDDPWHDLYQEVQTAAYQVHPYHHPVIGWDSDLVQVPASSMRAYYRRHYLPNRAVIVIAGDVKAERVRREVSKRFAKIPAGPEPDVANILPEPDQKGERRITLFRATRTRRWAVAYHTCRVGEPDDYALDLVSTLLTHGKSSRLYRKLVRAGIATHVSTENDPRLDPGLFWVGAEVSQGEDHEGMEKLIFREVEERLARELVTAKELKRAKKVVTAAFHFQRETGSEIAEKIGRWETQATLEGLDHYLPRIEAVTSKQIREVARRYFRRANRTVGISLPKEDGG